MNYELDYNLGTFVLIDWSTKSETTLSGSEAFNWSARSYCKVTRRADRQINNVLEDMQLCSQF